MSSPSRSVPTSTHWGNFLIESDGYKITSVIPENRIKIHRL